MFGKLFGKKEAPKKKTLDQMNNDELKELQNNFRKELRESTRQVDREIMSTERLIK